MTLRALAAGVLLAASTLSCGESLAPLSTPASPEGLRVRAVGVGAVKLTWIPVEDAVTYAIERRINHEGAFAPMSATVVQAAELVVFLDTDVLPETYYGYRVRAVSRFGDRSRPSVVGGARTPPPPGIVVATQSEAPVASAADPDGYRVLITGPDTVSVVVGLTSDRRFAPLEPGSYTVTLRGVIDRCSVTGDSVRAVVVPDTGVNTLAHVDFSVRCRDPQRGRIIGIIAASGDSLDANGFQLQLTGLIDDATIPDSLRIVSQNASMPAGGGSTAFDNLKPGSYELELKGVDAHCTRAGTATRTVAVRAASADTVRFTVTCEASTPDNSNRPLVWRNSWSAASAPQGARVHLTIALDASDRSQLRIGNVEGDVRYGETLLRYDSAQAAPGVALSGLTVNGSTAGLASVLAIDNAGEGLSGVVGVARLHFTVTGAAPSTVASRTVIREVGTADFKEYKDSTYAVEDTLVIGTTGTAKTPPVANANGAYSGAPGTAIAFSSAGSSDPDGGSIASYAWNFGDGGTSTQPSPSHTYAIAGTFTVSLTVTDDEGATATAATTATITAAAPVDPNKPLVWRTTWAETGGSSGQKVHLVLTVDASARPQLKVGAVDMSVRYNPAVLRYDRADPAATNFLDITPNEPSPGEVVIAGTSPAGRSGLVGIGRIEFTVLGTETASVVTQTVLTELQDIDFKEYKDSTRIVEDTLAVGAGGTTKVPPVANANGPYTGTAGTQIAFSSAGSNDPDGGSIATYAWAFGDNTTSTVPSPNKTYAAAGTYTVTLTVTDDEGASASEQTTVTVTSAGPAQPLIWSYEFSSVMRPTPDSAIVVLSILYDMRADLAETPSIETLSTWRLDSLKWNPSVLAYVNSSFGPGGAGSRSSSPGKLSINGTLPTQGLNSGLLTLATVRFTIVGQTGQSMNTQTWIGILKNATNFDYKPKTDIKEGTFTVP